MRTSLRSSCPKYLSRSEKAAPLGESSGTGLLVGVTILELALCRKVVVDRGMYSRELLQRLHAPKPQHRTLSSSEREVRVFRPVVEPAPHLAIISAAQILERGAIGPQAIGDDDLWSTMALH